MISQLKTLARFVTPIALNIYDKEDTSSILPLIAQVTKRKRVERKSTLEWWSAFPQLRKWVGDRKVQEIFKDSLEYEFHPYEETFDLDRMEIEMNSANLLANASDMAAAMARSFAAGKVMLAYQVLTDPDVLSYDGQNFYDTEHVHPDGTEFSNIVTVGTDTPARQDVNAPTPKELRAELKVAMARLLEITLVRNTLVRANEVKDSLAVITRNFATWSAAHDLLEEEEIDGMPNRFRGKFQLLQDHSPRPALANSYDVIRAVPGGPRPVIFVVGKEPRGVDFDQSSNFNKTRIPFGMDAVYGVAGGFPQSTVRVQQ